MHSFTQELLKIAEPKYKKFSNKLIPDTKYEIIGIRQPILKNFAKIAYKTRTIEVVSFMQETHTYHEEFILHGLFLSFEKNFDLLLPRLNEFIQYIDNWAVCDCTVMALKILKKHADETLIFIKSCLLSQKPYVIRFGIVCLLSYFLDKEFNKEILNLVLPVVSDNYYVNMSLAWFYSVALIKQYESTVFILENKILPKFVHNKSIQKSIESFRISTQTKNYLRSLKI